MRCLWVPALLICSVPAFGQQQISVADPCQNPYLLKQSAVISLASTTATAIVAKSGTTIIYVCQASYTISGTSPTSLWTSAATCGTSPTNLTGTMVAGTFLQLGGAGHTAFKTAAGANLCLTLAGTSPSAQGIVTFIQQ